MVVCGRLRTTLPTTTTFVALLGILGAGCVDSERGIPTPVCNASQPSAAGDQQHVLYFYSEGCPDCADVKENVIPLLLQNGILIEEICVDRDEGLHRMLEMERLYQVNIDTLAPVMLFDSAVLQGSRAIQEFFDSTN